MNIGIIFCWRLISIYMLALQLLLFGCTWSAELLSTSKRFWHSGFKVHTMHDTVLI